MQRWWLTEGRGEGGDPELLSADGSFYQPCSPYLREFMGYIRGGAGGLEALI